MDRRRNGSPLYSRQRSGSTDSSSSPVMSPAHPNTRPFSNTGSISNIKRTQNVAAKAAAQRLARVMASQTPDEDDDDDNDLYTPPRPSSYSLNVNNGVHAAALSYTKPTRSPSPALGRNFKESVPTTRSTSTGRPSITVRTAAPLVPPTSRVPLKTPALIPPIELPTSKPSKRPTLDVGYNLKDTGNQHEASALRDELDMLQEENENNIDKLRLAEERCKEAEDRARALEKQVASLGEGISLEAKLLSRKEAALRQREAALKAVKQTKDGRDEEISVLRLEVESAKEEATSVLEQLREAESESKALRSMTQRMILTQEEMEEVVLKKCWLARYWGLAVKHGICADIAVAKHEHWSSFAPLPFEVVVSAGHKAKELSRNRGGDDPDRSTLTRDLNDLSGEGNIECRLSVEMGLRELASLKVEEAVALALAQHRRPNLARQSDSPGAPRFTDAYDLSQDEAEDVLFKEAWLAYFWQRAVAYSVEEDIAEERLQFWINHSSPSPTSHDAVEVERGLRELRKLGIEQQLWEASRREIDQASSAPISNHK